MYISVVYGLIALTYKNIVDPRSETDKIMYINRIDYYIFLKMCYYLLMSYYDVNRHRFMRTNCVIQ